MKEQPKVLLVEDDRGISTALVHALQGSYDLDLAASGKLALYKTDIHHYDLVILDLNLPDFPGLAICQQLRERGLRAPILILSDDVKVLTKISLLDAGANDYLTKPFSLGELKARMRVLMRGTIQPRQLVAKMEVSGVKLDRSGLEVSRDGVMIQLRRKEFALLECLMEHAGNVVSRETLKRYVWQGSNNLWTNTVDVHVKSLRDKIDRPFGKSLIKTVHGLGYKLESLQTITIDKELDGS